MKNPNEIVLIKGNHEYLETSKDDIHEDEKHFYENKEFCKKIDIFFSTLPLAVFIGSKDKDTHYYTLLTHGAIDPDIDLNPLLNDPTPRACQIILKNKKARLSDRIGSILPDEVKNLSYDQSDLAVQILEKYICEQSQENTRKVVAYLNLEINKKKAKKILSILKIEKFLCQTHLIPFDLQRVNLTTSEFIEIVRQTSFTNFNWGDITENYSGFSPLRRVSFCFSKDFIKSYFILISQENRKVKALRSAHGHEYRIFSIKQRKGFIEILPAIEKLDDPLRESFFVAEIVYIYRKIKKWKKQMVINSLNGYMLSDLMSFY